MVDPLYENCEGEKFVRVPLKKGAFCKGLLNGRFGILVFAGIIFYMKKLPVPNFSHLSPVLFTPVIILYFRIYPRNFAKVRNGPNGVLRAL
jgi:hypothetical protein